MPNTLPTTIFYSNLLGSSVPPILNQDLHYIPQRPIFLETTSVAIYSQRPLLLTKQYLTGVRQEHQMVPSAPANYRIHHEV
ncbi:hypothetical protein KCU88_g153, partial [Aureobasidium melanogenum]